MPTRRSRLALGVRETCDAEAGLCTIAGMSTQVRELIEAFASKLEIVLKQDLRDAIERVIPKLAAPVDGSTLAPRSNGHAVGGGRAKRVKRDATALDELAEKFTSFVAKNPPVSRIEQINKELGTSTKDLALPIRKLLARRQIKSSGQKRSTTYSVGSAHDPEGQRPTPQDVTFFALCSTKLKNANSLRTVQQDRYGTTTASCLCSPLTWRDAQKRSSNARFARTLPASRAKDLAPIGKLFAERRIKSSGQKRSTTYSVGSARSGKVSGRRRKT